MRNRQTLIAEFRDGPYVGQRREMQYRQLFWRPDGEPGIYVRTGYYERKDTDSIRITKREYTADGLALIWYWHQDKPREGT